MLNTEAFKRASIDWLLATGRCESMTDSTRLALADLAFHGVDYEVSETPDFRNVALDAGDSFHQATFGEAFAATIYPLKADAPEETWQRYDGHTFHVGKDDLMKVLIGNMIAGVIAAADGGDATWKAMADQNEIARFQRRRDAEVERARRSEEARAKRAEKKSEKKDAAK
jgi:hypothetical protein